VARKPPPHGKKRTSWKPGQSGNPKGGRPKSENTWGAIFSEIANLTGKAAAKRCHSIAGQLAGIGDAVTLKEAVAMRVFSSLLFEPSGSLLEKVMDRMEGKLPIPMSIDWRQEVEKLGASPSEIFDAMVGAAMSKLPDGD
jgi:hypothetical protein